MKPQQGHLFVDTRPNSRFGSPGQMRERIAADDRRRERERVANMSGRELEEYVFEKYPALYREFIREVLISKRKIDANNPGVKGSARFFVEQIRWRQKCAGVNLMRDGSDYRINDHLIPYLARRAIRDYPELADFFETRKVKSE